MVTLLPDTLQTVTGLLAEIKEQIKKTESDLAYYKGAADGLTLLLDRLKKDERDNPTKDSKKTTRTKAKAQQS